MSTSERSISKLQPRREPDPDALKAQAQQVRQKVFKEIRTATKLSDKAAKAYICDDDLERIWSDKSRISNILYLDCPSADQICLVQKKMKLILSTLIWIRAVDCLSVFRSRFFNLNTGEPLFTDTNIPFEKENLAFLDENELEVREQFYENQFRFKPVFIDLKSSQKTQKLHPSARLPFESQLEGVGEGGYGEVDRVGISPRYIRNESGWDSGSVFMVACKKIRLPADFDKERENLQILRESLTNHERIMKHLATLEHGPNRYILLPYATYGDLEVFLHCGMAPNAEEKYNFNKTFPEIKNNDITLALLGECWSIAHAIDWLHHDIRIEKSSSTIFCAHMDLKPANILIDGGESVVGKWMISDFGISVFKEESQEQDSEYGSIRDYFSQITMNTRPKRQAGTYQAPEVKLAERTFNQASQLTHDQRGIGRKSDIWSFGCILSEILAFSLGGDTLVREFQARRKLYSKDDYFYVTTRRQSGLLLNVNTPRECVVKPAVLSWLENVHKNGIGPRNRVECFAGTIRKILIVDTSERPDAKMLLKLLKHVKEHVSMSTGGKPIQCPILEPKSERGPPPQPSIPAPRIPRKAITPTNSGSRFDGPSNPKVIRSTTFEKQVIHEEVAGDNESVGPGSPVPSSFDQTSPILSNFTSLASSVNTNSKSGPSFILDEDADSSRDRKTSSGTKSSHFSSYVQPTHAHGIISDPLVRMAPPQSYRADLRKRNGSKFRIEAMALTRWTNGARLACLVKSAIYIYTLDVDALAPRLDWEIDLQLSGWTGVAIAGNFLAAWGYCGGNHVHFCDIREHQRPRKFSAKEISMLEKVAISEQGVAALICRSKILAVTLDAQLEAVPLLASLDLDQNFTHAAFNETGDLLFGWAYGKKDTIYIWRCQDAVLNPKTESESRYETYRSGDPDRTTLLPYNTYQGCIVRRPDKRVFPAAINSSLRERKDTLPVHNSIPLFNLHSACIFNDHSLITVEKSTIHHYLNEYKIDYKNTPLLKLPAARICKLDSSTSISSHMMAIKVHENANVIICNMNGTVEFVKIMPA